MKTLTVSTAVTLVVLISLLTTWTSGKSIGPGSRNSHGSKQNLSSYHSKILKLNRDVNGVVELDCGLPAQVSSTQYEWFKQNPTGHGRKRMTQFRNRFELSSQGQVRIRSLTHGDSGIYICKRATSIESYAIQLTVGNNTFKNNLLKPAGGRQGNSEEPYSEPEIIKDNLPKEKIYRVPKGHQSLLLKCESKGNPKPKITWYRNDNILSSLTENLSTLKLTGLTQEDSGVYKCESVNIFGISVYELVLEVTDVAQGAAEILELSPKNLTIVVGTSVNISCIAKFESNPWFFWVKKVRSNKTDSSKVFFHTNTSAYYEVLQSTSVRGRGERIYSTDLVLTNVTINDTGVYFCAVAGLQGFNLSETTVIVQGDPSQLQYNNPKTVAAQWAIMWTSSFVILVVLIVLCFVRIYGCHKHQLKTSECKVNPPRKTHLPERSPQTMSTHCTTYLQGQEAFVPLMVGSCSLSSQDQLRGYESSGASQPYINTHHYFPDASSRTSSNSTLLADLEAARSYCTNSECPSKYQFESCGRKHRYGRCSASRNQSRRTRRTHRPHSTHIHHHHPKIISNSPLNYSYEYSNNSNTNTNSSNSGYGEYNLPSTDCESAFYEPKRKKISHHHRHIDYFYSNNSEQL